jgi:hypothetical protein
MIARRIASPILLLLCGSALLLYGAIFHATPVYEEKEREISIPVPTPFGMNETPVAPPAAAAPPEDANPFGGQSGEADRQKDGENPFETPPPLPSPPGVTFKKVTETFLEANPESEWAIVSDITVGGVTRLDNGQLKRTYSGKSPSLCPS